MKLKDLKRQKKKKAGLEDKRPQISNNPVAKYAKDAGARAVTHTDKKKQAKLNPRKGKAAKHKKKMFERKNG